MATSVTRHAITWTFSTDRQVGQYVNGDPYVVVPSGNLSITNITPGSSVAGGRTINGTMVNPPGSGAQGWDSAMGFNTWDSSLNRGLSLPLSVPAGSSVVSSVSRTAAGARPQMEHMSVLTVVSSAPASNSFRPPYSGTDKTSYWTESNLNYGILPSLSQVNYAPGLATCENLMVRLHYVSCTGDTGSSGRYATPYSNASSYGGPRAANLNLSLMSLCLNYTNAQKRLLFIYCVQYGIDVYGCLVNNVTWPSGGALNCGIKPAVVFAARALNSSTIANFCGRNLFRHHEDRQTWYVTTGDVGKVLRTDDHPRETYTLAMVGTAEWGEQHYEKGNRDDSRWGASYRDQNFDAIIASALATRLTGGRNIWNGTGDNAYFDYAQRAWDIERTGDRGGNRAVFSDSGVNYIQNFTWEMRNAYGTIGDYDGGIQPPPPTQVSQPTLTPGSVNARPFLESASVAIEVVNPSSGVTIRYTTDGSDPTTSSTVYSSPGNPGSPITITDTTNFRARGYASGYDDSEIGTATFTKRYFTSTSAEFTNVTTTTQTGTFPVTFDVTPSTTPMDGVVGVGATVATAYQHIAANIQFNTDGTVKARNAGAYGAETAFIYTPGLRYAVSMTVNITAHTYSATITAPGGSPVVIANGYAFRTGAGTDDITEVNYFISTTAAGNTLLIENIFVGSGSAPVEDVAPASISPEPGPYLNQVSLSITQPTTGAAYYYTTDGVTDPTEGSTQYVNPVLRTTNTTFKVRGFKSGSNPSLITTAAFTINGFTAFDEWLNMNVGVWTRGLRVTGTVVPSFSPMDTVLGVGPAAADTFTDLACILRFNSTGEIDARNADVYDSVTTDVTYAAAQSFTFRFDIDIANHVYDLYVTPSGDTEKTIATAYAFRSEHSAATLLSYLSAATDNSSYNLAVSNVTVALGPYGVDPGATRPPIRRQSWGRRRFR